MIQKNKSSSLGTTVTIVGFPLTTNTVTMTGDHDNALETKIITSLIIALLQIHDIVFLFLRRTDLNTTNDRKMFDTLDIKRGMRAIRTKNVL